MSYNKKTLDELRADIDAIDSEMLRLFELRMETALKIGEYKRSEGISVCDEQRERRILENRLTGVKGEFLNGAENLLKTLMMESKRLQRSRFNLYLIGMPDCGKTRMGKRLEELLALPLLDTDKAIMEKLDMSIDEIFEKRGEPVFRSFETMILKEAAAHGGIIVATGGGMPFFGRNSEIMKHSGFTVFLDCPVEELIDQKTANRPLLRMSTGRESGYADTVRDNVMRLYNERYAGYCAAADFSIYPGEDNAPSLIAERYRRIVESK